MGIWYAGVIREVKSTVASWEASFLGGGGGGKEGGGMGGTWGVLSWGFMANGWKVYRD